MSERRGLLIIGCCYNPCMFEGIKGMAGLAGLMKDLPRLKEQMEAVKARLSEIEVEAETGGGAVKAVASADMQIRRIQIDQAMFSGLIDASSAEDRQMAEDLIAGAVNAALDKAKKAAEHEMADAAAEMGLPLPPGGLGGISP